MAVGVFGLVAASNRLAIYNACSIGPDSSYRCDIYSNSAAMNDYNSNLTLETVSGILTAIGFVMSIGSFLIRTKPQAG